MIDPPAPGPSSEPDLLHRDAIGSALLEVIPRLVPRTQVREVDDRAAPWGALTCAVPLTGDLAGVLRVGMNEQMLTSCFQHMTGQDAAAEADIYDTLAEVSNILAGAIVRKLEDSAMVVELGLPMIASEEMTISSRRPMTYLSFAYEVRSVFLADHVRAKFVFSNSTRWSNGPLSRR